ncbi:1-(5-phosphoribosyl)-5-[(5-phosphoribosylamino)methylideneamino]imidazole-4-carboxamide isomerase [Pseudomarimonas arenosa]|uniref:1-(5-phosphoribosyl)-5-[(5-phosphoribosylamino)methylideneamino] imidazole-4-carboxamide isomerase n=1 Tax=Pseudomarimonas arenosa TaxID=2774145 RepID=A0AAW3ZP12_9GAMM|nr:1-(5-phosphoribosyl)-5-[(5-phosphoribosylamino)methylideneamino]imidazole-4-carboxamide isomerase [Pseudomarimonas arenosa]MBD8527698.1 1-(5-phosphoribosyl)-5-[(5-phosphoribosylamino)methylideneamino]imidazole-4-carboxamide isomerase [Pseudomarimonas arenosa]
MSFVVYPAIDVRSGRVVRLRQGDYAEETRYADDPLSVAERYAKTGAQWLHLVDLDAARNGGYGLNSLLKAIKRGTNLQVQTGGGVRSVDHARAILEAGADRVVIGSLAVSQPEQIMRLIDELGADRVTVALDARQETGGRWTLPTHGWTAGSGVGLVELLAEYRRSALRHLLCTDIGRDGMLSGPNIELYRALRLLAPTLRIQASGGVRHLADVQAVRAAELDGIVLGKALLEGLLQVEEALAC